MVARTLTALAVGDSAGVPAGVAAAEAAVLTGAGGCGALESAEPQAEITRVAAAINIKAAFRIPSKYYKRKWKSNSLVGIAR